MRVIIDVWGHEFTLEVGLKESVVEIKRKMEQLLGIPMASQTLAVCGWELVDGLDMEDYPIVTPGTKIDLTVKSMEPTTIPVIIKISGKQHQMQVSRTETVYGLKEKIHIIDGTPIKRISLFFCGIELENDFCNLSEYGVNEFSEILLLLKTMNRIKSDPPSRRLSLVVQTSSSLLNATSIPVRIKDSNTVNELRQLLLSRKLLPIDDYLFIHRQMTMRENCSLRSHGVEDGDPIYVFKGTVHRSGY
ncbi:uncharacterized protein LOC103967014 [Pyrus x bretschneideri]|uniref:uncharacterized protein LOC103967014 n=1 Tax=Pyrus x bretschneideri TaxID=225117 RepID=UPI000510F57D|nr:uncharacterized protein LOC103967014 [Pyrus x bretschneideri]